MSFVPFLVGIVFILIHLLANALLPAERIKRMKWFSFSGGLAVSYIFIYLLPTLHREQAMIEGPYRRLTMESEIYIVGLVGVVVFLGIQIIISRREASQIASFWTAVLFYALYNALVSFVVLSLEVSGVQAIFYSFAIGLHFIAIAHDMWRGFPDEYNQYGRQVLAAGIVVGWVFALTVELAPIAKAIIFAFVAGAMIFNVFKHELPNVKEIHFFTFLMAVALYSAITISLKFFFEW
ncbi:hypothetical protein [Salisediminibacterium halotolerans]|uniref:hypothetical protein n=1 Tax=Salisediminibacterium halotolerans TaxID=517425 RepID=UPI000EAE3A70|nr:hypothetical protein [Salisediminibacterium halotolerans]RLJ71703.1 hypothetical protein BCL39_2374 [Actinophytocola xinjiangensis]RPE86853.1 hypothetical protein EDD67_1715 [Salisediminibacterium halotolerans]TWG32916.1 hypothetical protein BCL52_2369 [Salisediminibacterium halotolerans]GEL07770.1 hypothetical protein SHA02_11860 [Salisediminibacterium halotolerans]